MNARNRSTASNMIGNNRLAAPLSSHRTGGRQRIGGDGDGGTAIWKTTPLPLASSRSTATARQEKSTIASTLRAASIRNKALSQKPISPRKARAPINDRKLPERSTAVLPSKPTERASWTHRKSAGSASVSKKDKLEIVQVSNMTKDQPGVLMLDQGVQTDEAEIMNRELLIGDIKLLMPSAQIANQIDKLRWESKNILQHESKRKFASHEHDEEQHLDELKEFMERSYVTRRIPKKPPILASYEPHQYGNVFKYMDDCFTREVPKAESITNIQERIRRKEQELMSMFNEVDTGERSETDSEEN